MGRLFGSKRVDTPYSIAQRMLEDKDFKYSSDYAMQTWIFANDSLDMSFGKKSLADYLIEARQNNLPHKFDKAYRYASKPERYTIGLPTSSISKDPKKSILNALERYLANKYTTDVTMQYAIIGDKNFYHMAWQRLIDKYGYSGLNNELKILSAQHNTPCYLLKGQLTLTERTLKAFTDLSQYGLSTDYGKCFDREQDTSRSQKDILQGDTDKFEFTYAYAEPIFDITNPEPVVINRFTDNRVIGYAEYNSTVEIYKTGILLHTLQATDTGYFTQVFADTPEGEYVFVCKDKINNISIGVTQTYPFTNPNPVTKGSKPTGTQKIIQQEVTIDLSDINPVLNEGDKLPKSYDTIQACYLVDKEYKWFTYDYLSGLKPDIDSSLTFDDDVGEYYPRFYTRINQQNVVEYAKDDTKKKQIAKLYKSAGMDLADITKKVHEGIGDNVWDSRFVFIHLCAAINKQKDDIVVAEYLYRYFQRLFEKCDVIIPEPITTITKDIFGHKIATTTQPPVDPNNKKGLLQDIADGTYAQTLVFDGIRQYRQIGKATFSTGKELSKGQYVIKVAEVVTRPDRFFPIKHTEHQIYYQIEDNTYSIIRIKQLALHNRFWGHTVTASGNDENLVIPLDRLLVKDLHYKERELLFNKCLHVQVSLIKTTKVKWYQRKIFKVFMAIVAIGLAFVFPPAGATLGSTLVAAATNVAIAMAISLAINLVLKVAVDLGLNEEVAGIIALITGLVIASYTGQFDFAMTAQNIMYAVNTTFQIANKVMAIELQQIQQEMENFAQYAKTAQEKLSKAQELLGTGVMPLGLDLLTSPITSSLYINLGETAQEFYTRTTLVDVRELTQNIASDYVKITTQLPSFRTLMKKLQQQQQASVQEVLLIA